jgi:hypothetical protein
LASFSCLICQNVGDCVNEQALSGRSLVCKFVCKKKWVEFPCLSHLIQQNWFQSSNKGNTVVDVVSTFALVRNTSATSGFAIMSMYLSSGTSTNRWVEFWRIEITVDTDKITYKEIITRCKRCRWARTHLHPHLFQVSYFYFSKSKSSTIIKKNWWMVQ